jgi:Family of unknown function (DUF6520)
MKKIKVLLYSAAFVLALSASFAFKPIPNQAPNAFITKITTCDTPVYCNGGSATCVIQGKTAFANKSSCTGTLTMQ